MSHNTLSPKKIILTLAVVFIIGYGVFNSRFLIKGPEIAVAGLDPSGEIIKTESKDFSLTGTVTHSSYISVNNRPISIDESGNFNEKLLLSNGISIIDIYARDKFGKEVRKQIDVVYSNKESEAFSSNATSPEQIALRVLSAATSTEMESSEEGSEVEMESEVSAGSGAEASEQATDGAPDPAL